MASHSRSSAAMRSSNQCRIGRPSLRSGVAVRPSSSTGSHMVEELAVRRRRRVMELVDDHDVEVIGRRFVEVGGVEALDRSEDVVEALRAGAADPLLAERRFAQRVAEGRQALVEDLLAVRDEQQARRAAVPHAIARSRRRPSPSCPCRWRQPAGCGGDHGRATARSVRAAAPGTVRGEARSG